LIANDGFSSSSVSFLTEGIRCVRLEPAPTGAGQIFIPDPFSNPALAAGVIASGFFMLRNHEIIRR
jgi:hypothetical protein